MTQNELGDRDVVVLVPLGALSIVSIKRGIGPISDSVIVVEEVAAEVDPYFTAQNKINK